jgi:flagella basal body P-ring formation protein FlgA
MGDAAPGARFLVKVEDTRNPVQAVAIEAGRATLPGWAE